MKKLLYPLAFSLVTLTMTSCIENLESDGVKSMRESQAALLQAMAQAQSTSATADAALKAAQTALDNAQADIVKAESAAKVQRMNLKNAALEEQNRHNAAMNALSEALASARNDQQKASIDLQMKEEAAKSAYQLKVIENQQIILEGQIQDNQNRNEIALLHAKLQLDKAQKEYDVQLQKQSIKYTDNLENLKYFADKDLLRSYNNAYQNWAMLSDQINQTNIQIGQFKVQLLQDKAFDQQGVTNAKARLDLDQKGLDKLNEDLTKFKAAVPNVDAVNQLVSQYQGEVNTLTNENTQLQVNINASQKNYDDLSNQIALFLNSTLNPLGIAQSDALSKVSNAKAYLDAATNYLNNTTGMNNIYDFDNKIIVVMSSGYQPKLNGGPDGAIVAIKDAIASETDDANAEGVYPSPADQMDVVRATEIYNKAKKYYDDAKTNYDNSFATWQSAHDAYQAAQTKLAGLNEQKNEIYKNIDPSVVESDQSKYSRNMSRIITTRSYINNLTSYLNTLAYTDPETNAPLLYASITNAIKNLQNIIKNDTDLYESAEKSYEQQKPMNEIDYARVQGIIDSMTADVAAEENELALLKAILDEWTAKLTAALPQN